MYVYECECECMYECTCMMKIYECIYIGGEKYHGGGQHMGEELPAGSLQHHNIRIHHSLRKPRRTKRGLTNVLSIDIYIQYTYIHSYTYSSIYIYTYIQT